LAPSLCDSDSQTFFFSAAQANAAKRATTGALSALFEYHAAAASAQDRHLSAAALISCADATVENMHPTAARRYLRMSSLKLGFSCFADPTGRSVLPKVVKEQLANQAINRTPFLFHEVEKPDGDQRRCYHAEYPNRRSLRKPRTTESRHENH
jgi:hypothetical protein